ncbi:MAG: aminotransferase class V-fold PLP-dependent enzyme [Sandaracinus sp.]|nr:aminotransferase class V-fold PLP-dependent enzyme [Sandaracinus sp.]MCB9620751.1 aminotransferase class V-fold PLP-dependent enzyme [Sandaracinus sp.]MCB9624337.1 aminotransferase class V-fold PLP-dependent enzyme [Sandaracinus sp.]
MNARLGDRSLFSTLRAKSYLAHAAISPLSDPVKARVDALTSQYAEGGVEALPHWLSERTRLRGQLAGLIGAQADDVGFVQSTTPGVVWLAFAIDWKPGDRVILFEGEFPANVTPWQRAAETFGLEIVTLPIAPFFESVEAGLASVEHELSRGARLVAVSEVRFQDGYRMPTAALGELAHRHGAELFVDAIQALGVVPVDVTHVDYLVSGAHKWLMGLEGAGFVYVDPSRIGALVPRLAGWLGHVDALRFLFDGAGHLRTDRPFREKADVVEQGALSGASLAALQASVELLQGLGVDAIYDHVQAFHDALEPGLVELGFRSLRAFPEARSGSLCLEVPEGIPLAGLAKSLGERGVVVSTPDGFLRFAPHWPNASAEVPFVLEAVHDAVREIR